MKTPHRGGRLACHRRVLPVTGLVALLSLVGCAGPRPVAYSGLSSAPQLRPSADDDNGRTPFAYSVPVDWRQYYRIIIEPVEVSPR
jgi:hypothetical protein